MEYNEQLKRFETSFKVDIYNNTFTTFITTLTDRINIVIGAADYLPYVSSTNITGNTEYFKARSLNLNNLIGTCVLTPGRHGSYDESIRYLEAYRIYDLPSEYPVNSIGLRYTDILTGKYADVIGTLTTMYDENGQMIAQVPRCILPYGYSYGGSSTTANSEFYFLMCTVSNGSIADITTYIINQSYVNNNIYASGRSANTAAIAWFMSLGGVAPEHTDPFAPGGTSETGGGGMSENPPIHNPVDYPTLPTISATNAGMVSIWVPTLSELQRFAAYLWNTNILTSGFWKNLVSSPIDLFYGLNIMPVPIDRQQVHTDTVTFGWIDTEIMWDYIDEQYVEVDCGTLDMDEYWKAYLDYAPYTKIDIYLPYIGVKHLNTNDIMDKAIHLKYVIDLASGACVAMIKSDDSVLYHFTGNCATPIPVSSIQFQEIVRNITSTAVSAVGGILGAAVSPALGAGGAAGVVSGAIKTFTTDHAIVNRSGALGSSSGLMGVQIPYLIISRPRMAVPENQNTYTGYPSFITETIGDLTGYTEIEIIHMHDLTCTSEEFTEIEDLLLKGVII